jgi:hypothetical protein
VIIGARHFALLRRLNPQLHRKFSSDRLFFSGTPHLDLDVDPNLKPAIWASTKSHLLQKGIQLQS